MITSIEQKEGEYNARDVLSMCRVYSHLADALESRGTVDVYEIDEQLAELALQMTRVGMPVNSQTRQDIGARLRALREEAVKVLQPYTEDLYRESFLTWVATFFAAKPRKGEPIAGSMRVGPTRAQADLDDLLRQQREWRDYKKTVDPADKEEIADCDESLAILADEVRAAKLTLKASRHEDDANDGLVHTAETAFDMRKAIRRADAELAISKKGVNYRAKVVQAAILRAAGVPLTKITGKSGLPQVDKEILASFKRHPSAAAVLKYILVSSTINVYIEGENRIGKGGGSKPVVVSSDGYLHPQWVIHKITGRWGSSPNVQNWSKRAGGGEENLRDMIEAPEGYILVGADQAQLEARLVTAMSQCQYLLGILQRGEDIHGAFAAVGFPEVWPKLALTFKEHKKALSKGEKCKCETCAERDRVRDQTKRLEYGAIYGGQDKAIWEALVGEFPTLTQRQVRLFIDSFNQHCPEVLAWRQQVLADVLREGLIRSPILGRCQVFPLGRVDPTVAYNYKAQSGGADLWALGAIEFCKLWDQYAFEARICHNGHDSVLILCREELADQVIVDVGRCWNRTWNGVPFFMESKKAKRWSET